MAAVGTVSPTKKSRPRADQPTGPAPHPIHANAGARPVMSRVCEPQSTCVHAPAGGSVEGLVGGAGVVLEVVLWSSAAMTQPFPAGGFSHPGSRLRHWLRSSLFRHPSLRDELLCLYPMLPTLAMNAAYTELQSHAIPRRENSSQRSRCVLVSLWCFTRPAVPQR